MCSPEIPDDPNFQPDITNMPPTFARFLSFHRTTNSSSKWHKAEFARKVLDFGGDQSLTTPPPPHHPPPRCLRGITSQVSRHMLPTCFQLLNPGTPQYPPLQLHPQTNLPRHQYWLLHSPSQQLLGTNLPLRSGRQLPLRPMRPRRPMNCRLRLLKSLLS